MRGHWRVRRRVRIGKLVALNVTRRSISISLGWRGLTLNLGARGVYVTLSAPGTGVSYRIGAPWTRWLINKSKSLKPRDEDILEQGDEPWIR